MRPQSFFVLLALAAKRGRNQGIQQVIYVALAILFQPLVKIALGRMIWNMVDVIVGVGLIISIFNLKEKSQKG